MYERLKRFYLNDQISEAELDRGIELGFITAEQKQEIINAKNPPAEPENPIEPTE